MENIIGIYFFSANHVTIMEYLANYFINILGFAFPIFILIALILLFYQWGTGGFDKSQIRQLMISFIMAISIVSILLYTNGRKTIIYKDSGQQVKSYLIVDTLNDLMALSSRFADAFVYNMLFGENYTGSNEPIIQLKKGGGIFELQQNNNQPTSNDIVDGYFVNSLQQLLVNKINKNNKYKQNFEKQIQKTLDKSKKNFNNGLVLLKDFSQNYLNKSYYPIKYISLNGKDKGQLLQEYLNTHQGNSLADTSNMFEKYYINLNNYDDFIKKQLPDDLDYTLLIKHKNNFTNINVIYKNTKTIGNKIIFQNQKLVFPVSFTPTVNNSKNTLVDNKLPLLTKNQMKDMLNKVFINSNTGQNQKKDFAGIEMGLKKDYKIDLNDHLYMKTYPSIMNNLKLNPNSINDELNKTFQLYPSLNKKYYNISELKQILMTVKNLIRFKIEKRWDLLETLIQLKQKTNDKDVLPMIQLKEYLIQLKNRYIHNRETNIDYKPFIDKTINNSINIDINKKLNNFVHKSLNSLYLINNGIDIKNNNSNGIPLKYLENSFLLVSKYKKNNLLLDMLISPPKANDNVPFHWYNLGTYAIGLKSLFMQNASFYTFAAGFKSEIDSKNFLNKCLPYYYEDSSNINMIANTPDYINKLCFPGKGDEIENGITKFANIFGLWKGLSLTLKTISFSNFIGSPFKILAKLLGKVALGGAWYVLLYAGIYFFFMFVYFLIPLLFFVVSFFSWVFKASLSIITFGFSILFFIFTSKREQLQESTLHIIMYTLMPIYISLIFLLAISTSFIISETVDSILPNYTEAYYKKTNFKDISTSDFKDIGSNIKESFTQDIITKKLLDTANNTSYSSSYRNYYGLKAGISKIKSFSHLAKNKIHEYYLDAKTVLQTTSNIVNDPNLIILMIIDFLLMGIKLVIILVLEIGLYSQLWKVDKYINEIIGTRISDAGFNPDKIVSNFSKDRV